MTTKHWMKQSTNTRMLRTIITGRTLITTGGHRSRLDQHELGHSVTTKVDHNTIYLSTALVSPLWYFRKTLMRSNIGD